MTTPSWFSKLYNRNPPHTWALKSRKIMSPSFYYTELNKALAEQAYGLAKFDVSSSTSHEAAASVTLLEGKTIRITLSARGYQVRVAFASSLPLSLTSFSLMVARSMNLSKVSYRPSVPRTRKRGGRLYSRACEACDGKSRFLGRRIIDKWLYVSPFVSRNIVSC
jgi:hypothetical protein